MRIFSNLLVASLLLWGGAVYADDDDREAFNENIKAEQESKLSLFIGGEIGYAAALLGTTSNATNGATTSDFRVPYGVVGGKAGIIGFFGEKKRTGLRGYVSYHYSSDGEYYSHQTAFNAEAIWKLGRKFGIYAGLGVGYAHNASIESSNIATTSPNATTLITEPKGSGFILPVNIGFEVALDTHHTVSVNVRGSSIAASERLGATNGTTTYSARNILLTVGYAYQF